MSRSGNCRIKNSKAIGPAMEAESPAMLWLSRPRALQQEGALQEEEDKYPPLVLPSQDYEHKLEMRVVTAEEKQRRSLLRQHEALLRQQVPSDVADCSASHLPAWEEASMPRNLRVKDDSELGERGSEFINHDPMPMQEFFLPPPRELPDHTSRTRRGREPPKQCEVCKLFANLPYRQCGFCKATKVFHHGRCCPMRTAGPEGSTCRTSPCEVCGESTKLPYAYCMFCLGVQVNHQGRCCPSKNVLKERRKAREERDRPRWEIHRLLQ